MAKKKSKMDQAIDAAVAGSERRRARQATAGSKPSPKTKSSPKKNQPYKKTEKAAGKFGGAIKRNVVDNLRKRKRGDAS